MAKRRKRKQTNPFLKKENYFISIAFITALLIFYALANIPTTSVVECTGTECSVTNQTLVGNFPFLANFVFPLETLGLWVLGLAIGGFIISVFVNTARKK